MSTWNELNDTIRKFGYPDTLIHEYDHWVVLLRPQQVTLDLESFLRTTSPEVRKELQGRYPKHAWPEDPLTASPQRRPGRR